MDNQEIEYALAKQLPSAYCLQTDYGELVLDDEMSRAIDEALRPILARRLMELASDLYRP